MWLAIFALGVSQLFLTWRLYTAEKHIGMLAQGSILLMQHTGLVKP